MKGVLGLALIMGGAFLGYQVVKGNAPGIIANFRGTNQSQPKSVNQTPQTGGNNINNPGNMGTPA